MQSRYYNSVIGRFVNMDCQFNVGNLPLGTNLFVYCNNSPVGGTDPKGTDTYAVGGTVNANAYYRATFSLAFVFDSYGGFDIQYSYAFAGIDHSHSFGVLDVGMGGFFQYTQLDQVNDLLGVSASVGASGGTGISFGIDAVSSGYVAENVLINGKESPDGVQFTAGVGFGIDVHIVQSNTVSILGKIKSNLNQIKNKFDAAVSGFWDKVRK